MRYGPVKCRPSTLAESFIRDLLEVTGGGKATSFVDARDRAMIRMLTEGVRREELAQQQITDLSEDLIARPFVRVVPLKDARDFSEGTDESRVSWLSQVVDGWFSRVRIDRFPGSGLPLFACPRIRQAAAQGRNRAR